MAADDDEILDPDEIDSDSFLEEGEDADEDPEDLLDDEELDGDLGLEDGDETVPLIDEDADGDDAPVVVPKKKSKKGKKDAVADEEEDDEDDELVGEDDVEADLGVILDARIKGRSEDDEEEAEEEEEELPSSTDPESSIQPRRADERMCNQCFLLVRKGAPACPVGDDTCPLFG